ncbi:MAG: nucleotidyltransferase domain-containing protein [Victivallales bacterium]|nr:nucleotidyltransferase domain-containing protein [Victivallales bacterium]
MCQLDRLKQLKEEILQIARKHNAEKVYVFGSCARKEETPESDIDFIADFKEHTSIFDHAGLEYDLAQFLGCKVDVVAKDALLDDSFAANVRKDMVQL